MKVEVNGGAFYDENYAPVTGSGNVGARMALEFQPNTFWLKKNVPGCDGTVLEFHLVQIVREIRESAAASSSHTAEGNVGFGDRQVPDGPHQGWGVDVDWQAGSDEGYLKIASARKSFLETKIRDCDEKIKAGSDPDGSLARQLDTFTWQLAIDTTKVNKQSGKAGRGKVLTSLDPRYAQQRISLDVPLFTSREGQSAGNAAVLSPPYPMPLRASLRDAPAMPVNEPILGMEFEVAALLEYGPPESRRSRYLGSVKWKWQRSPQKSDVKLDPLALVSASGVSEAFKAAVAKWNQLRVSDPGALRPGDHEVLKIPAE